VARSCFQLFAGHPLVQSFLEGKILSKAERDPMRALVADWRGRLIKDPIGAAHRLKTACKALGYRCTPNLATCRERFT
jgi:hypothetical protein